VNTLEDAERDVEEGKVPMEGDETERDKEIRVGGAGGFVKGGGDIDSGMVCSDGTKEGGRKRRGEMKNSW
jgi:phage baseplate assembly protein gpV